METQPNPHGTDTPGEKKSMDQSRSDDSDREPDETPIQDRGKLDDSNVPEYRSEKNDTLESDDGNVEINFTEQKVGEELDKEENDDPLLDKDSVKIDIKPDDEGEDTPTLPLRKKKSKESVNESKTKLKEKPSMYLFPITRMKLAWARSSNVFEFVLLAIAIIFSTLGWFCCIGGMPLMSLAMLIIGSVYVDDCNIQPNIPVYLIVSGVFGTVQHVIAVWTKYVPKDSQGRLKVYRAYCKVVDCILHLFLAIWFILGCIWVYGVYDDVDFRYPQKDEYCHKSLYYFAFWVLNLSFILLSLLIVGSLCCILCIVASPKEEDRAFVQ